MTVHRRSREPPQRCAAPGCPFLTRETYCPLHRTTDNKENTR